MKRNIEFYQFLLKKLSQIIWILLWTALVNLLLHSENRFVIWIHGIQFINPKLKIKINLKYLKWPSLNDKIRSRPT